MLHAAHSVRKQGDKTDDVIKAEVDAQDVRLAKARARVEELRATLLGPKEKVRVAESSASLPMPGDGA